MLFRNKRGGFTLTELLVVIGIVGIMLALLLPNFSGLGRGAKMNAALNQLESTLSLARQWAITKREKTYVVFPDEVTVGSDTNLADKAFRAYCVYGANSKYLSEWKYLPEGIVFVENSNTYAVGGQVKDTTCIFSDYTQVVTRAHLNLPFPENNSAWVKNRVIAFSPTGAGITTNTPSGATIYLAEGWVPMNGSGSPLLPLQYRGNTATNRYLVGLRLNEFTGQFHVEDYRL